MKKNLFYEKKKKIKLSYFQYEVSISELGIYTEQSEASRMLNIF